MKHSKISAIGLEYTLLKGENGGSLIGIEIACNTDCDQKTRKFIEKYADLIYEDGWRFNFWAKGIAFMTKFERVEIALPRKEMSDLRTLFDKARPERKLNLVPIFGKYPGFQMLFDYEV